MAPASASRAAWLVAEIHLRELDEADRDVDDAAEFALAHARHHGADEFERRRRNAPPSSRPRSPRLMVRKSAGVWRTPGLVTSMSGIGAGGEHLGAALRRRHIGRDRVRPARPSRPRSRAPPLPVSRRVRATSVRSTPSRASAAAAALAKALAAAADEGVPPPDTQIHRDASSGKAQPRGAKEPASSRGGTRKRPATSFSCSRSVMTSARSPVTSTRRRQKLRIVAGGGRFRVAAGIEEGDIVAALAAPASCDAGRPRRNCRAARRDRPVSVALGLGIRHRQRRDNTSRAPRPRKGGWSKGRG